jgi:hypothetical protein
MTMTENTTQTDQSSRLRKSGKALSVPTENDHTAQACAVIEVIVEQLELFGFDRSGYSTKGDVKHWTALFSAGVHWVKVAKYKIASFYQVHQLRILEDKTLPAKPFADTIPDNPRRLLGGRAGRFIGKMLERSDPELRESFLSSMLQIKRAMPLPDEEFLEQAKLSTIKAITTPKVRISVSDFGNGRLHGRLTFANITREVIRTTKELFGHKNFTTADLLSNPHMPSLSANHVTSRAALGTFGYLLDAGLLQPGSNERLHVTPINLGDKGDPEESIRASSSWRDMPVFRLTGLNSMRDTFVKTYFDTIKIAQNEEPIAEAVALAEALKARVITKGPPATQFCLKPLQRFMHSTLKCHPVFELIGTPDTAEIVERQMKVLPSNEFWLSGDYSDATNQLDPKLSNSVWETLCNVCCVPTAIRELGFRALTGHLVQSGDGDSLLPQKWGQLMGSIISFPILCVINAAICRMSMEHSRNRVLGLRACALLVNGDDCVFPVDMAGYRFWQKVGSMSGLSPSVGKVYLSRNFLNIDSTTYVYTPRTNEVLADEEFGFWRSFYRVPLVRLGLILGVKRSTVGGPVKPESNSEIVLGEGYDSLGSRHQTLMAESPKECLLAVHLMFLRKNREILEWCRERHLPWYVPKCYGGVGLCPMPSLSPKFAPSLTDRKIVTAMVLESLWNVGPARQCVSEKPVTSTQIHVVATAFLESAFAELGLPVKEVWVLPDDPRVDGFDCPDIDLWVTYNYPELAAVSEEEVAKSAVRRNTNVWLWYEKNMSKFSYLVPFEELKVRKRIRIMQIVNEAGKAYVGSVYHEQLDVAVWGDYPEVDVWA